MVSVYFRVSSVLRMPELSVVHVSVTGLYFSVAKSISLPIQSGDYLLSLYFSESVSTSLPYKKSLNKSSCSPHEYPDLGITTMYVNESQ